MKITNLSDDLLELVLKHTIYIKKKKYLYNDKQNYVSQFLNFINNLKVPKLDIGGQEGMTGYIDFIKLTDMDYPIMKGIDKYKRLFLVVKYKDYKTDKQYFTTFFQRYSDNDNDFRGCGHYGKNFNNNLEYGLKNKDYHFLIQLITNKIAIYENIPEYLYSYEIKENFIKEFYIS